MKVCLPVKPVFSRLVKLPVAVLIRNLKLGIVHLSVSFDLICTHAKVYLSAKLVFSR